MDKRRRWKGLLVFALTAVLSLGMIREIGLMKAADSTADNAEISSETEEEQMPEVENTEGSQEEMENVSGETEQDISQAEQESVPDEKTEKVKNTKTNKKRAEKITVKKAENGQTLLDVSKGNILITEHGAEGGGLEENETELNQKGYWITGTTDQYNIIVEEHVKTFITLQDVNITSDNTTMDCINVSHADVTITLRGENRLLCTAGTIRRQGCALAKDGMDGALTLQCESADIPGHKCSDSCGKLTAKGDPGTRHAGAIGNTVRNSSYTNIDPVHMGFANFTIKGGVIEVSGGQHCPGIGSACVTEDTSKGTGYTKNIRISGGIVNATGTDYGSGIGSGYGNKVDGVYITGGTVIAKGGKHAPGIGASAFDGGYKVSGTTENLEISGGDTVVMAIGDQATNMPGIGAGMGKDYVRNAQAVPNQGFQGYIQDGESEDVYSFANGTPFKTETQIEVEQFFTMVYFGPFRDENEINSDTNEQISANNIISKSGGDDFSEEQLKSLSKLIGKNKDGEDFSLNELFAADAGQIEKINAAKKKGEIGEFPLTFQSPAGTQVTITVYLKEKGSDGTKFDPENPTPTIGADNFAKETGGEKMTSEDVIAYAGVKGKDAEGNNISAEDFSVDQDQLEQINKAKTERKAGEFDLTFKEPNGTTVTIKVRLIGEFDEIYEDPVNHEIIKGQNIVSKTGGEEFTKEQLKELSRIEAVDQTGKKVPPEKLNISDVSQMDRINQAKKAGQTGEFPLTFTTENGTEVTVTIYLRDEGSDGAKHEVGSKQSSIAANNAVTQTGGSGLTEEDIKNLCDVKGKNQYGETVPVSVDKNKLEVLNTAKESGKTGKFPVTFSIPDGTSVTVNVILMGNHTVTFDSNGGDYQPGIQIVPGGGKIRIPVEPKKQGYTFQGWYYTDENGTEKKWNFDDPVNQGMELKAKWKKNNQTASGNGISKENPTDSGKKKTKSTGKKQKEEELPEWGQYQITGSGAKDGMLSKTSDFTNINGMLSLFIVSGSMGGGDLLNIQI